MQEFGKRVLCLTFAFFSPFPSSLNLQWGMEDRQKKRDFQCNIIHLLVSVIEECSLLLWSVCVCVNLQEKSAGLLNDEFIWLWKQLNVGFVSKTVTVLAHSFKLCMLVASVELYTHTHQLQWQTNFRVTLTYKRRRWKLSQLDEFLFYQVYDCTHILTQPHRKCFSWLWHLFRDGDRKQIQRLQKCDNINCHAGFDDHCI